MNSNIVIPFRKKLNDILKIKGMSPYVLAKKANMSAMSIWRILNGETKSPRPQNLEKIADALDMPVESLIKSTDCEESVDIELLSDAVTAPKTEELQTAESIDLSLLAKADPSKQDNCFGLFNKKIPVPAGFSLGAYVCVQAKDNALAPTICAGDLVYIERIVFGEGSEPDPSDMPREEGADIADGNLIAALIADKEKPFVLLGEKVTDARGRVWVKRYAADPDGNTFFLVKRYLGLVAGISREFPRKYLDLEI